MVSLFTANANQNSDEHNFCEIEALNSNWSVRTLQQQYNSNLYDRIALSRDKSEVLRLSSEGNIIAKPQDIIKQPTVLEFLGIEEKSKYAEYDNE